jgi:polysaccharide pyruvyl transferase CsaB
MKIAICGYYGVFNVGDEAILTSFKKVVSQYHPESEVLVMGTGDLFPFGIRSFLRSIIRPSLWYKPYKLIKSCDKFILGGGGLFTPEEMPWVPTFWALHGVAAYLMDKPVYCLGISVSSLTGINKFIVKWLFKHSKEVVVRDKVSYELVKEWRINCKLSTDLALALESSVVKNNSNEQYIVLSVRSFKKTDEKLYTILAQLCDSIVKLYGLKIRLIPFQKGDQYDVQVLRKIFDLTVHKEQIILDNYYENLEELISVLGQAKAVIAMRLHAGILATVAGTPFVAMSYMQKVSNFWAEFNDIEILDFNRLELSEMLKKIEILFKDLDKKRQGIKEIRKVLEARLKVTTDIIGSL